MLGLVVGFIFSGYVFVYAAVANGGKLAPNPWQALYLDAYTGQPAGARNANAKPSTLDRIAGGAKLFLENVPGIGPIVSVFGG